MSTSPPILYWFRRDFRLADNPALAAACASGRPVLAVFVRDGLVDDLGAAPKWRLGVGLDHFISQLSSIGVRVILRSGPALDVIQNLVNETGADTVYWTRAYDPQSVARDTQVKSQLKAQGIHAQSFGGHLLFEPWTVETKTGGPYRVYTPFWNAVKSRDLPQVVAAPKPIASFDGPIASETLADWNLGAAMVRGLPHVAKYARIGEAAAMERLVEFCAGPIDRYNDRRDAPYELGTSGLSQNLALGEISPLQCWYMGYDAMLRGSAGAETFLKELVWREFAYHLMHHTPHIVTDNWKPDWDKFPWNLDETHPHVIAWKQGRTGIPFVDAAMREMYVTGTMHNRGRMIVASYLTKHLMSHWKIGLNWFADCLIDWDPASNAMGWQWASGSGPDAAPYFRVFNPVTQLQKFDPAGRYARQWIAELHHQPTATALAYFDAIPKHWNLRPNMSYPEPIITPSDGRARALDAYQARDF